MRVFVDTNVLVYARDASEGPKQAAAAAWLSSLWERGAGRLSMQVLQEYYVTTTQRLTPGLAREQAREDVRALLAWDPVVGDGGLVADAWRIQDRYGFSLWDCLIVAAAERCACDVLLTEDLQAGQDLDGMRVVDPFRTAPAAILG
jgi:predicted nucleic acid-binding protein